MIALHQSQFLPWVPYFFKVIKTDTFVVLDDVQFQKNGVQNRNKIKTLKGDQWLTVPVSATLGTPINRVTIEGECYKKILKTLEHNYKKAPYFNEVYAVVESAFKRNNEHLHDINKELFAGFLGLLDVQTQIHYSSELDTKESKDDLVIEIIKKFGQSEYLSGKGALAYMDLEKFRREGIEVHTYDFAYSPYPQLWTRETGFIPDLSMLDLMCNDLPNAREYVLRNGVLKKLSERVSL